MINITQPAFDKIKTILAEENMPGTKVRVFVEGGGCSGFNYGFQLDTEQNDDDFILETCDNLVIVDSASMNYLIGSTIDIKETLMDTGFIIENPNATGTCGCGSSFSA
jgi:iron-sulfur cluster insertion protein